MNKAFLILFEKETNTSAQRKILHDTLTTDKNVKGWWHYITNSYIIITDNTVTAGSVRDFLQKKIPNTNILVLQITYNDYDGFLKKEAWDWMENSLSNIKPNKGFGNLY